MERTARAAVMPVSYGWSDVGSWQAVWEFRSATPPAMPRTAPRRLLSIRAAPMSQARSTWSRCSALRCSGGDHRRCDPGGASPRRRRIAAHCQKLKEVAPALTEDHLKVHRPWGSYQSLDMGERYQVKRIVVKQGGRLSLQLHHHRAEHWVVVRGTARVTIGDKVQMLHENESIYMPSGSQHRLENPGKIDLELIEVQTGSYLGEDDIVRIEDDYHRS